MVANKAFIVAGIKNLLKNNYSIDPQTVDVEARVDATLDYKNLYKVRLLLHNIWVKRLVSNVEKNLIPEIREENSAVLNAHMGVEKMISKEELIKSVMYVGKCTTSQITRGIVQNIARLNVKMCNRAETSKKNSKKRSSKRNGLKIEEKLIMLRLKKKIIKYLCIAIPTGGLSSTHLKRDVFYAKVRIILMFIILMRIDKIIKLPTSHHYVGDVI